MPFRSRNVILNALRECVERLERASEVQFTRIAQVQADVDRFAAHLKRVSDRKGAT